jgi:glyoxylase-like metal-dependent hydrolase (beta-lactamase superfamily II)
MRTRMDLIDLDQKLPGQRRFISCWLARAENLAFVVDPGPPATGDYLIARLEKLGLQRLDFILLTHIHLDHGGATAQLVARWPEARVLCHPRGRAHLIDPGRLWQGSRQVLGRKADVYGEPRPVPPAAIAGSPVDPERGIVAIETPGHAPHHLAFLWDGNLFAGEAAGTFSSLGLGPHSEDYYLRPATPPRFFLPVAAGSLERLLDLDPVPRRICFAHHGQFTGDVRGLLNAARDQLYQWVAATAAHLAGRNQGQVPGPGPDLEALLPELSDVLRAADPRFARGVRLPADIQERERDFTRQTLRGILGYLAAEGLESGTFRNP